MDSSKLFISLDKGLIVTLAGHMLSVVLAHDLSVKIFGHQKRA